MASELDVLLRPLSGRLAPALAARALELGLAVTHPEGDRVPIPVTLTPVVVADTELVRRSRLAARLASAGVKMTRAILGGPQRGLLLDALSPLERSLAEERGALLEELAITRVDFFLQREVPWALEINSTIPAMPGYSDIAAQAFLETVGEAAGLGERAIESLKTDNGSNVLALHQALLSGYAKLRSGGSPKRVAILCRRNDPQITELAYCVARFNALGLETEIVFPDELHADQPLPRARGRSFDLIYRHLFVRRLEQLSAPEVVTLFRQAPRPGEAVLLNPPSTPVEVKTTFALLSQSRHDPALASAAGLTPEEQEAIAQTVPWTRPFRPGPSDDPEGRSIPDLVAQVAAAPERFVLKRAWDYGGRAVFVGATSGEAGFLDRSRAAFGEALDWPAVCARAAIDTTGGGFVVQQHVAVEAEPHLLCTAQGPKEAALFVDFSAYASVALTVQPAWGGVCRGSLSQVVNIVGGGGVLPLLRESVVARLVQGLRTPAR